MSKKPTATSKRKAISKKTRFEIFKRDKFTCQYCGKKSPDIVLNVDHIKPVASGGTNAISNLVTSCFDCNSGKGKRELSDGSAVEKQRTELEIQQERINQIKLMSEWQLGLIGADDASVCACSDILEKLTGATPNDSGKKTILRTIRKCGLAPTMEAIQASVDQYYHDDSCWEKMFSMIVKIARVKAGPEWKQSALKFSSYAKRNGSSRDDQNLFNNIINKHQKSVDSLDFECLFENGMNLRQYCEAVMIDGGLSYEGGE